MEELGRALIQDLAGPFIEQWIARAQAETPGRGSFALAVAREAIAGAAEDPELMRFILAEHTGAIGPFRAALGVKLSAVSTTVGTSLSADGSDADSAATVGNAVIVLVLGACNELLDAGKEHATAVTDRVSSQIRLLLDGWAAQRGHE
jgi:hypothetical protein